MSDSPLQTLEHFDIHSLPDLDTAVLGALELFQKKPLPEIQLDVYKRPLVVGSGNAAVTGKILFENTDAVFADESTYEEKLQYRADIDGVVLISASGGKHSPIIAKCAGDFNKHVTLITTTRSSPTQPHLDHWHEHDEYVFPKNREPYTYNTSTYMGMILSKTKEDPTVLMKFLAEKSAPLISGNFASYDAFYLIVPPQFDALREMFLTKFDELFGAKVNGRVFTLEQTKHAKTVVPSDTELFVSFGKENNRFGNENARLNIPLPDEVGYGGMLAVGYYVIGHIQKQHPPYFKENIVAYTKQASEIFGHSISPVVK